MPRKPKLESTPIRDTARVYHAPEHVVDDHTAVSHFAARLCISLVNGMTAATPYVETAGLTERLADEWGCSTRTIERALAELRKSRYLELQEESTLYGPGIYWAESPKGYFVDET